MLSRGELFHRSTKYLSIRESIQRVTYLISLELDHSMHTYATQHVQITPHYLPRYFVLGDNSELDGRRVAYNSDLIDGSKSMPVMDCIIRYTVENGRHFCQMMR